MRTPFNRLIAISLAFAMSGNSAASTVKMANCTCSSPNFISPFEAQALTEPDLWQRFTGPLGQQLRRIIPRLEWAWEINPSVRVTHGADFVDFRQKSKPKLLAPWAALNNTEFPRGSGNAGSAGAEKAPRPHSEPPAGNRTNEPSTAEDKEDALLRILTSADLFPLEAAEASIRALLGTKIPLTVSGDTLRTSSIALMDMPQPQAKSLGNFLAQYARRDAVDTTVLREELLAFFEAFKKKFPSQAHVELPSDRIVDAIEHALATLKAKERSPKETAEAVMRALFGSEPYLLLCGMPIPELWLPIAALMKSASPEAQSLAIKFLGHYAGRPIIYMETFRRGLENYLASLRAKYDAAEKAALDKAAASTVVSTPGKKKGVAHSIHEAAYQKPQLVLLGKVKTEPSHAPFANFYRSAKPVSPTGSGMRAAVQKLIPIFTARDGKVDNHDDPILLTAQQGGEGLTIKFFKDGHWTHEMWDRGGNVFAMSWKPGDDLIYRIGNEPEKHVPSPTDPIGSVNWHPMGKTISGAINWGIASATYNTMIEGGLKQFTFPTHKNWFATWLHSMDLWTPLEGDDGNRLTHPVGTGLRGNPGRSRDFAELWAALTTGPFGWWQNATGNIFNRIGMYWVEDATYEEVVSLLHAVRPNTPHEFLLRNLHTAPLMQMLHFGRLLRNITADQVEHLYLALRNSPFYQLFTQDGNEKEVSFQKPRALNPDIRYAIRRIPSENHDKIDFEVAPEKDFIRLLPVRVDTNSGRFEVQFNAEDARLGEEIQNALRNAVTIHENWFHYKSPGYFFEALLIQQYPAGFDIEVRFTEHDHVEIDLSGPRPTIVIPAIRVPDRASPLYEWQKKRLAADLASELNHLLLPNLKDNEIEPGALRKVVAYYGLNTALHDLHLPYTASPIISDLIGQEEAERLFPGPPSPFALSALAAYETLQADHPELFKKNVSPLQQADFLFSHEADRYMKLIFPDTLWQSRDYIIDLDGMPVERNTHPLGTGGRHGTLKKPETPPISHEDDLAKFKQFLKEHKGNGPVPDYLVEIFGAFLKKFGSIAAMESKSRSESLRIIVIGDDRSARLLLDFFEAQLDDKTEGTSIEVFASDKITRLKRIAERSVDALILPFYSDLSVANRPADFRHLLQIVPWVRDGGAIFYISDSKHPALDDQFLEGLDLTPSNIVNSQTYESFQIDTIIRPARTTDKQRARRFPKNLKRKENEDPDEEYHEKLPPEGSFAPEHEKAKGKKMRTAA